MSVTDFQAVQKWAKIPRNRQQLIVNNVFCSACLMEGDEPLWEHEKVEKEWKLDAG